MEMESRLYLLLSHMDLLDLSREHDPGDRMPILRLHASRSHCELEVAQCHIPPRSR